MSLGYLQNFFPFVPKFPFYWQKWSFWTAICSINTNFFLLITWWKEKRNPFSSELPDRMQSLDADVQNALSFFRYYYWVLFHENSKHWKSKNVFKKVSSAVWKKELIELSVKFKFKGSQFLKMSRKNFTQICTQWQLWPGFFSGKCCW